MDMRPFGQFLREKRLAAGLSQNQLAALAKTTQSTISHMEIGRFRPSLMALLRLAQALSVPPLEMVKALLDDIEAHEQEGFSKGINPREESRGTLGETQEVRNA